MKKENWEKALANEFKIHFKDSPEEFEFLVRFIEELLEEEYKKGYNKCLKDQGKVGERWLHLYL